MCVGWGVIIGLQPPLNDLFFLLCFDREHCQLHTFPEGKVTQDDVPIRRLKWGTASLIVRSPITPIVLPIVHRGFDAVVFFLQNYSNNSTNPANISV